MVPPTYLRWLLALSFLLVALWALQADRVDDDALLSYSCLGAFALTVGAFFLAEIGDRTQVATKMLAARFNNLLPVVAETTLGVLIADLPVILPSKMASQKIPFMAMRVVAAGLFALLAVFDAGCKLTIGGPRPRRVEAQPV